jgi:hypothetical protein
MNITEKELIEYMDRIDDCKKREAINGMSILVYAMAYRVAGFVEPEITEDQEAKIGRAIAIVLMLKKDSDHGDRYITEWGNKTAIGLYRTVKCIINEGSK